MDYRNKSEEKFFQYLINFLKQKGYPESSLVYESAISIGEKPLYPDFTIIDPTRNERLAIVEIINSVKQEDLNLSIKKYSRIIENPIFKRTLILFAQSSEDSTSPEQFNFFRLELDGTLKNYMIDAFPSFNALASNEKISQKQELKTKEKKTKDRFKIICFRLAFVFIALIFVDLISEVSGFKLITAERLTLIGILVALFVVPFAAEFKFLGIEWKRLTGNDDK